MRVQNLTIVEDLQPSGLYKNQTLQFGSVNYFIGRNGSGKTQVLQRIYNKAKSERVAIATTKKGIVVKYLSASRAQNVTGNRAMHSSNVDEHESENMTAESFYQFLHASPFTKTLVEHQMREFFHKEAKITIQGQGIAFNLFDRVIKRIKSLRNVIKKKEEAYESAKEEGDVAVAESTQEEIEELIEEMRELNLSNESDGMKELLILLTFIYHPRVKVVLIDEPETHLHPHMINFLTDAIADIARTGQKQFFIITHAPTAVRLVSSKDWKYFFFHRAEELERSKINCFDEFEDARFKRLIRELNPYKREAFYSDTVILVEGIDDFYFFDALTRKLGYAEYDGGGTSFFPCWGGHNLETYYEFFQRCGKKIFVIADSNISTNQHLSKEFRDEFLNNPQNFIRLSRNDLADYCQNTELEKSEKVRREIEESIESDVFDESRYQELVDAIRKIMGIKKEVRPNIEFTEIVHRMVNEFQMRFKDRDTWKEALTKQDANVLIELIQKDVELNSYWQDSVIEEFQFQFEQPWKCRMVFRSGNHQFSVSFDENSRPSDVYPQ